METTYAELDGDREVVYASLFRDCVTTIDAREVHVGRLDDTFLTLGGLDQLFGESGNLISQDALSRILLAVPEACVCHGQSRRSCTILCLDNLVTTKLYA